MNETTIRQLMERFLNAETTLEEERTLYDYFHGEDIASDLMPYREVFQSFSAVNGIEKVIGLFFAVQGENNEVPLQTMATNQTEHTPDFCEGSTPRELYVCYLERKREQSKTYRSLKRMIYENQQ